MDIDYAKAKLLMDVVHSAIGIDEARSIARWARDELVAMSKAAVAPKAIPTASVEQAPAEPPANPDPTLNLTGGSNVRRV